MTIQHAVEIGRKECVWMHRAANGRGIIVHLKAAGAVVIPFVVLKGAQVQAAIGKAGMVSPRKNQNRHISLS